MKKKNVGCQEDGEDFKKCNYSKQYSCNMGFPFYQVIEPNKYDYKKQEIYLEHNQVIPEVF